MKTCKSCQEIKVLTDFYFNRKYNVYFSSCKLCIKTNPNKWRNWLRSRYNISEEEHSEMLEKQNYTCAICKQPQNYSRTDKLYVDHCHVTSKVRGLLCNSCNTGLGNFKDNPNLLRKAATYLS